MNQQTVQSSRFEKNKDFFQRKQLFNTKPLQIFNILLIAIASCFSVYGEEKVVWQENFEKTGTMENSGWKPESLSPKDDWKIKDGKLKALCAFRPYRGSNYSKEIPFVKKGILTFDVNINSSHAQNYRHLSLILSFYNITTSFTGLKNGYMRSYMGKWKGIGKIPNGKWTKCKIVFDVDASTVEYYLDDMKSPAMVDTNVKLKPGKNGRGRLVLGNYGLANTTVLNEVDNIRLIEVTDNGKQSAVFGNTAMVFRGIAFNYYQLNKIIKALDISESRNYTLVTGLAIHSKNNLYLDKKPPIRLRTLPKYIIMADMPLKNSVPDYVQSMIKKSVQQGSTLLILGGLFTLNKGDFHNTPITKIIPVEIGSPWAVLKLKTSAKIKNTLSGTPVVRYLHPLKPLTGAKVLVRAGKNPFIVSGKCGKGKVIVCLGMPCGKFPTGETPFWEWNKWPEFIAGLMK